MLSMTSWEIDQGLILTDIPVLPMAPIMRCMQDFMSTTLSARCDFLQKDYGFAFDGYSHYGQADSTHQSTEDLLHSFVFSDFYAAERHPKAFQASVREPWAALTQQLRSLEMSLLAALPAAVGIWYQQFAGHMMYANYYPPLKHFDAVAAGNTRLSAHPDVSLFTVFPFGLDSAFEYQDERGQWLPAPATNTMIAFPGYLLEWLSNGSVRRRIFSSTVACGAIESQR
jgi:isopenicillin N synthase-like dioxygenase